MTLSTLVGLPIGTYLLMQMDPVVMKRTIAGVVAACVITMLLGGRFRVSPSVAVHIAIGLLAGVVLGATYIALVAVIFFFSLPASAAESRANNVFWGVLLSLAFIATHMMLGNIAAEGLWRVILVGIVYLAGTAAGAWWFRRTGERGVPARSAVAAARTGGGRAGGVTRAGRFPESAPEVSDAWRFLLRNMRSEPCAAVERCGSAGQPRRRAAPSS